MTFLDVLNFIIIAVLMIIFGQYNLTIISAIILGIYFIGMPSWWNGILLFLFIFLIFVFGGLSGFELPAIIILGIIYIFSNLFSKKKDKSSGMDDFAKLFGGMGG